MAERKGLSRIRSLHRQWKGQGLLYCLLLALFFTLLLSVGMQLLNGLPLKWGYAVAICAGSFVLIFLVIPYARLTISDTSRYLDAVLPALEESCGLLEKSPESLGPLERLQADRIEARLMHARLPHPLRRKLVPAFCLTGFLFLTSVAINTFVKTAGYRLPPPARQAVSSIVPVPDIRGLHIRVIPPAYTGRPLRDQQDPDLRVEEGAMVYWEWQTDRAAGKVVLIFNDTTRIMLAPADEAHTIWRYQLRADNGGFYQWRLEDRGKRQDRPSPLFKMEVIRDEAPRIHIQTPAPHTILDYGEPLQVVLKVQLQDDYGIADAEGTATIASGSGEAVKFREQPLPFDHRFSGHETTCELRKVIDLSALHPGDELYFYIKARDNHGQQSRSDMYIISLADTAQLMSLEGLTTGVNIKPEFFRSERQIIIETEQLLKEKDTIAAEAFKTRSNDLGIDQKLLRLRYGKFLGEESEEGDSGDSTFRAGLEGPGDFGNAAKTLKAFTDEHDRAEDATFFEPAIKEKLKATLTEMWNAELRLRTFRPGEALPYCYKALRLLKELQQQSRVYVAKTGVKITPPDPGKRLSGNLSGIQLYPQRERGERAPKPEEALRIALAVLDQYLTRRGASVERDKMNEASIRVLQLVGQRLAREAAARPGEYLKAYQAMRKILEGSQRDGHRQDEGQRDGHQPNDLSADIALVQRALHTLLPVAEASPSPGPKEPDGGLSELYYRNLNGRAKKP